MKRWWYCLGEWPPSDYEYVAHLTRHELRRVDAHKFKSEPEYENGTPKNNINK
jgi:hypothetical protein